MGNETENSGLPDWASEQLKRWNSLAFRTLPPTKCDRDNVAAVEKRIADLEQQLADTKMRLLAYEKHYGVMTGAAVYLILTGTLPFKDSPQEQDDG